MKEDKVFLDTNILIYAYDVSSGSKHDVARNIVADLWNFRTGILSIQVLQELYINGQIIDGVMIKNPFVT
ncbi:MAG: hypothetical protein FD159_2367 [Syntrophaceae bacterium]|nr:MAG: hypothetical protein FD159_2367 [Syntrophaceae bacterium]